MPKEIAHFALARCLGRALTPETRFYTPVNQYPCLFLLGAVAPDTPFYYLVGPRARHVQALARPFHGSSARSLLPVLEFLARYRTGPALALAAGAICHILCDTRFHGMVYYYAGMDGLHTGASARHRQFETAMDLHFHGLFRCEPSLYRVVRSVEIPDPARNRLLEALFQPRALPSDCLAKALAWHVRLHCLFRSGRIRQGLTWLKKMGTPLPGRLTGLVYPCQAGLSLPFFSGPVPYQDPCTGEFRNVGIQTLVRETVRDSLKVLAIISGHLNQNQPLEQVMSAPDLPWIRPGLPRETFCFWQNRQDLGAALYRGTGLRSG